MGVALVVYFDTNVVRDLSEDRKPDARNHVTVVKELIDQKKLVIAPSFEVLYEILSAPDVCDATRIKNAQFYEALVNWGYALKPPDEMLRDDIVSCLHQGGPSTPYHAIDDDRSKFIQSIRTGNGLLTPKEWENVVKRSRCQNEKFVNNTLGKFVKKLPRKSKTELRNHPEKTWEKWWAYGGLAEAISIDFARGQVRKECSLLVIPSVRAAVGFLLRTWYRQIIDHVQLKPTDHHDFRNAVLGAGVGRIVTEDNKLRNAIKHIPDLNVDAWTLAELIAAIT
jgi:hypothetical protein